MIIMALIVTEDMIEHRKKKLDTTVEIPINKKHIRGFIEAAETGALKDGKPLSKDRVFKYLTILPKFDAYIGKDFKKATKKDIEKVVDEINKLKNKSGNSASDWTKYTYKVLLRRFYKWLFGNEEYPKIVKWIHPKITNGTHIPKKELINMEDVKKMAQCANNLRDRAFILFLFESGARIGEILSIKIGDFTPDEDGALVNIPEGKTGPREIRIIASPAAISNWLLEHPDRNNKKAPLFCGLSNYKRGKNIQYQNYRLLLQQLADKAGIDKRVNPHRFRHARATELAKIFTESYLCKYMGWTIGSKEAATYVHKEGLDANEELLIKKGLKADTKEKDKFLPIECPRCHVKNDPAANWCSQCRLPLDEKTMMEYDRQKEEAAKTGFQMDAALNNEQMLRETIDMLSKRLEKLEKQVKNK